MTGQVKEDVISRFGELGVEVNNGIISFSPEMLRDQEFLKTSETFKYVNLSKEKCLLEIEKESLCFTYCQVPVIYSKSNYSGINIDFHSKKSIGFENNSLDIETSKSIFNRENNIKKITVYIQK